MEQQQMQERLTEIEIRVAHIDQSLHELSDVIYAQQKLIERLDENCKALMQRLEASAGGGSAGAAQDEKPPHY